MSEQLFWMRANSLKLRYKRSLVRAQRKHLACIRALSKITGLELPIPVHLCHLEAMRHG